MFSLNSASGELIFDGEVIAQLSPSEIQVLQCLLNSPDKLVAKEILLDAGWPDKVVQQNSLAVAIKNIRKALAIISNEQIIETKHRKGYILHSLHLSLYSDDVQPATPDISADIREDAIVSDYVPFHKTRSQALTILRKTLFYLAMATMVLWCLFLTSLDHPLTCHEIGNSSFCGYSKLTQDDIATLQEQAVKAEGSYVYGYDNEFGQLQILKMD